MRIPLGHDLPSGISIRPIENGDEAFLREMLYLALYVPAGGEPFPRSILDQPEISRYVRSWGRPGDDGVIAVYDAAPKRVGAALVGAALVGAAWTRLWTSDDRGYGYVADEIPELSMAVLPEYRGQGIGTRMLADLLQQAERRFDAVSLSVSTANPAVNLYRRFGFEAVASAGDSLTMLKRFFAPNHP